MGHEWASCSQKPPSLVLGYWEVTVCLAHPVRSQGPGGAGSDSRLAPNTFIRCRALVSLLSVLAGGYGGVDAALQRSKLGATIGTPGIWVASSFSKQLGPGISPGHSGGLQGQCKMSKSLVVEREAGGQAEQVLWR